MRKCFAKPENFKSFCFWSKNTILKSVCSNRSHNFFCKFQLNDARVFSQVEIQVRKMKRKWNFCKISSSNHDQWWSINQSMMINPSINQPMKINQSINQSIDRWWSINQSIKDSFDRNCNIAQHLRKVVSNRKFVALCTTQTVPAIRKNNFRRFFLPDSIRNPKKILLTNSPSEMTFFSKVNGIALRLSHFWIIKKTSSVHQPCRAQNILDYDGSFFCCTVCRLTWSLPTRVLWIVCQLHTGIRYEDEKHNLFRNFFHAEKFF